MRHGRSLVLGPIHLMHVLAQFPRNWNSTLTDFASSPRLCSKSMVPSSYGNFGLSGNCWWSFFNPVCVCVHELLLAILCKPGEEGVWKAKGKLLAFAYHQCCPRGLQPSPARQPGPKRHRHAGDLQQVLPVWHRNREDKSIGVVCEVFEIVNRKLATTQTHKKKVP